jgi:hypothetical protein
MSHLAAARLVLACIGWSSRLDCPGKYQWQAACPKAIIGVRSHAGLPCVYRDDNVGMWRKRQWRRQRQRHASGHLYSDSDWHLQFVLDKVDSQRESYSGRAVRRVFDHGLGFRCRPRVQELQEAL